MQQGVDAQGRESADACIDGELVDKARTPDASFSLDDDHGPLSTHGATQMLLQLRLFPLAARKRRAEQMAAHPEVERLGLELRDGRESFHDLSGARGTLQRIEAEQRHDELLERGRQL